MQRQVQYHPYSRMCCKGKYYQGSWLIPSFLELVYYENWRNILTARGLLSSEVLLLNHT